MKYQSGENSEVQSGKEPSASAAPPATAGPPRCREVRHGVTHPILQVQVAGTPANYSFRFGLRGLIPFWVLVSYRLHNSKQSQPKPMCFAWFRGWNHSVSQCSSVTINWPRCTQILAYICLKKKKKSHFFHHSRPKCLGLLQPSPTRSQWIHHKGNNWKQHLRYLGTKDGWHRLLERKV